MYTHFKPEHMGGGGYIRSVVPPTTKDLQETLHIQYMHTHTQTCTRSIHTHTHTHTVQISAKVNVTRVIYVHVPRKICVRVDWILSESNVHLLTVYVTYTYMQRLVM